MPITILDHPLAQHLLTQLRDRNTEPEAFRRYAKQLTTMLVLEATRKVPTRKVSVETPLTTAQGIELSEKLAVVPILRAGLGMLEPVLELFPNVTVGYIGLERNEATAVARSYYSKLPVMEDKFTLCVDPMLATGGSAAQAVSLLKASGAKDIAMVSVIAAPEGVATFERHHPEVPIVTAGLDECLNDRKYIVPGLGDFGDRLFGTG
jgi:uracil phosphoribosyltransferase